MISNRIKEIFKSTPGHDTVVDSVRALSVLATIVFHILAGFLKVWDIPFTQNFLSRVEWWMVPLFHAEKGVDAFFLLSGFVLGVPIFRKVKQFDWSSAKIFYWRRFFRIYPLFLFALIFYHLLRKGSLNTEFFANLLFINNFSKSWDPIIPVGWSLTIEVQLYILVPILIFLIQKVKRPQILMIFIVLVSFLLTALTLGAYPELINRPITDLLLSPDRDRFGAIYGKNIYETFTNRFSPFVIGLWLAYLKVNYDEKLKQLLSDSLWSSIFLGLGMFLILSVVFVPLYSLEGWYIRSFSPTTHFYYQIFSRQIFSVGLAILMLGTWYGSGLGVIFRKFCSWNLWAPFSKLAYPIYLFHYPCIVIAALLVFRSGDFAVLKEASFFDVSLIFLLSCLISILVSIPLHIYIEKKFMNFRRGS